MASKRRRESKDVSGLTVEQRLVALEQAVEELKEKTGFYDEEVQGLPEKKNYNSDEGPWSPAPKLMKRCANCSELFQGTGAQEFCVECATERRSQVNREVGDPAVSGAQGRPQTAA